MIEKYERQALDIETQIDVDFRVADHPEIRRTLNTLRQKLELESNRVVRSVLFLAQGNVGRLRHYAARAEQDYRDVIYWAEYDRQDNRVRDLSLPFAPH